MRVFFCWLVQIIRVIIMIPFLTLLERKILRYIQLRKGPKKVRIIGILQPIGDGVKLFFKERGTVFNSKSLIFWFSPLFKFRFMLILFILIAPVFPKFSITLGVIVYLCFSSLLVYTVLRSGWRSNSKFAFLGRLRGAAQIISYEIRLLTLIFFPLMVSKTFKVYGNRVRFFFNRLIFIVILVFWIIVIVAETNRSPFDFAEGERELVSGFKTEYRRMGFALLFLGEYGKIIFIRIFTSYFFFPLLFFFNLIIAFGIIILFLIFRGTFPRFRYDFLMSMAWKVMLPWSLILFWLVFIF